MRVDFPQKHENMKKNKDPTEKNCFSQNKQVQIKKHLQKNQMDVNILEVFSRRTSNNFFKLKTVYVDTKYKHVRTFKRFYWVTSQMVKHVSILTRKHRICWYV